MKRLFSATLLAVLFLVTSLTWGQSRNNGFVALPSAAYTATATSADLINPSYRGVHVLINVSAYTSGNFTPKIQGKDPVSGNYYDILVGAAISSAPAAVVVLKVYPGITAASNVAVSDIIPQTWRITMVGAATPVATFSVSVYTEY